VLPLIDSWKVGSHPLVSQLLRGISFKLVTLLGLTAPDRSSDLQSWPKVCGTQAN
jgi:hypothetical protein